jgi:hypothetical protein
MKRIVMIGLLAAGVAAAAPAWAQDDHTTVVVSPRADIGVQVGAGTNTYSAGLDKLTDPGTAWEMRVTWGLRQVVGAELAFVAGTNGIHDANGTGAQLETEGTELLLRTNLGMKNLGFHPLWFTRIEPIPYLAAGVGVNESKVIDADGYPLHEVDGYRYRTATSAHFPAAVGVEMLIDDHVTVGARLAYRWELANAVQVDAPKQDTQSWQALGRLGVAF